MELLWQLFIGGLVGVLAGYLTSRDVPLDWIGNIVAGLLGSWLGEMLLGSWGPEIADMYLFPSIIGSVLLVLITSMIFKSSRNTEL